VGTVVAQVFHESVGQCFCWLTRISNLFRIPAITRQLFARDMRSWISTKTPSARRWNTISGSRFQPRTHIWVQLPQGNPQHLNIVFIFLRISPWLLGSNHVGAQLCRWCYTPMPGHCNLFRRLQRDNRLNQLHLVLIQWTTWLKLRILRSQVSHPNHKANTRLAETSNLWYRK